MENEEYREMLNDAYHLIKYWHHKSYRRMPNDEKEMHWGRYKEKNHLMIKMCEVLKATM